MTWSNFRYLVAALIAILALIILASTLGAKQLPARFHFVSRDQIDSNTYVLLIKDSLTGSCYANFITGNNMQYTHGFGAVALERVLCAHGK